MEVIILESEQAVAEVAARRVLDRLALRDTPVLGVATGSSPLAIYRALAEHRATGYDPAVLRAFALDEYIGLPAGHPQSYAETIRVTVTEPLGLQPKHVHVPDGASAEATVAADAYDAAIAAAGGIDVQILGIGSNGHIGFNEPGSSLASRTRVKTLDPRTRADNARFFESLEFVPTHCVTQGLGTIMDAREVVLTAFGENKADAIAAAVEGPVSALVPASILQHHRHASILVDEAAASKLTRTEYYRHAWRNRNSWLPDADGRFSAV